MQTQADTLRFRVCGVTAPANFRVACNIPLEANALPEAKAIAAFTALLDVVAKIGTTTEIGTGTFVFYADTIESTLAWVLAR